MVTAQQFERIQQLVQPITTISSWLLPKVLLFTGFGALSLAWLTFYVLQFWTWHYVLLIPIILLALPVGILAVWSLLLWDLTELPEALESLRESTFGLKERITTGKNKVEKAVVNLRKTRQLPSLLKELLELVQGVDTIRTIVMHVIFLGNPISWLLLLVSCLVVMCYGFWAVVTGLLFWL